MVSFAQLAGDLPISPRIQRTAHLTAALEHELGLRVARVPDHLGRAVHRARRSLPRGLARKALSPLLLDHLEIPAGVALRGWRPAGRGALLIAWPYSPIYAAATRLVAAGIPYVVDVGDPWVLTEPAPPPWQRRLSLRRARSAETFLWRHAAAGIVTTEAQASGLRALFPDLDLMVRPNGYLPADEPAVQRGAGQRDDGELRLVHFGSINSSRVPIGAWLSALTGADGIRRVRFANYGPVDHLELLQAEDAAVAVETHDPVDWVRACQVAQDFDAAVVVGNADPAKLPSKAIQYLTLPVPRIGLTASAGEGELAAFASRRPGFVAAGLDSPEDIPRVIGHVRRAWSREELSPPAGDSWTEVAGAVARFAIQSWDRAPLDRAPRQARRVATA